MPHMCPFLLLAVYTHTHLIPTPCTCNLIYTLLPLYTPPIYTLPITPPLPLPLFRSGRVLHRGPGGDQEDEGLQVRRRCRGM